MDQVTVDHVTMIVTEQYVGTTALERALLRRKIENAPCPWCDAIVGLDGTESLREIVVLHHPECAAPQQNALDQIYGPKTSPK